MQAETGEPADFNQSAGQTLMPICFNLTEQFERTCSAWEHYCTSCKLFQTINTPFLVLSLENLTRYTVTANHPAFFEKAKTRRKLKRLVVRPLAALVLYEQKREGIKR